MRTLILAVLLVGCGGSEALPAKNCNPDQSCGRWCADGIETFVCAAITCTTKCGTAVMYDANANADLCAKAKADWLAALAVCPP